VRINEELLERKVATPAYKTEITDRRESLLCPRYTPLHTKAGTNFRAKRIGELGTTLAVTGN
jgi:hypothetical protein